MKRTCPGANVLAAALLAACLAASAPVGAVEPAQLPSPLDGPGLPELRRAEARQVERGWRELESGDLDKALKRARRAGAVAPAELLAAQVALVREAPDAKADLVALCDRQPVYAAAWITLSVAAEGAGDEIMALFAARRGAELWSAPRWTLRVDELEHRWVTDRLARARELLEAGSLETALAEARQALELEPNAPGAAVLEAEILVAAGQLDEAEAVLDTAPEVPEARLLRGRIAELRGDWQSAMESYSLLPADHPARDAALERAQVRWRLSVLPTYVRDAMSSPALSRGDLAVILVSLQPRLETLPGGSIPVMSDIVDQPGQREILTAVRLGILDADLLDHRFHPEAPADPATVRRAVDRSAALLGVPAPPWCDNGEVVRSPCTELPSPPTGGAVVSAVLGAAPGAG